MKGPNARDPHGQIKRGGYHTKQDIDRTSHAAKARDNIAEAFAGDENEGSYNQPKLDNSRSTNLKSRRTQKSSVRTPIR